MRDPTKSRNYSPAREEFRREHERRRKWGLMYRHAEKLRRLDDRAREQELAGWLQADRQDRPDDPAGSRTSDPAHSERNHQASISKSAAAPASSARRDAPTNATTPAKATTPTNATTPAKATTPTNATVPTPATTPAKATAPASSSAPTRANAPTSAEGPVSTTPRTDRDHRLARSTHDQPDPAADRDGNHNRGADGEQHAADQPPDTELATLTNPPTSTHRQHKGRTRPPPLPHSLFAIHSRFTEVPGPRSRRRRTTGRSPPPLVHPHSTRPQRQAAIPQSRMQFPQPVSRFQKCHTATGSDVRAGKRKRKPAQKNAPHRTASQSEVDLGK